jgi:hypothetical protein
MSKWIELFGSHEFHVSLKKLQEINNKIDISSIVDAVALSELARITKTLDYIEKYLKLVDPELNITNFTNILNTLKSNFDAAINSLNSYVTAKNITYLTQVNSYIDTILTHISQFHTVLPKVTAQSISSMLKEYNNVLNDGLEQINLVETIEASDKIKKLKYELIDGINDEESIEIQIDNIYDDFKGKSNELQAFYNETLNTTEFDETTKELIEKAKESVEEYTETTKNNFIEFSNKIDELEKFYIKVYGEVIEDKRIGGLEKELSERITALDAFKNSQEKEYKNILDDKLTKIKEYESSQQQHNKNLFEQIEFLLPGATTAGLAKAYEDERVSFKNSKRIWSGIFIASLVVIGIFSYNKFKLIIDTKNIWVLVVQALPINALLIWLALFATKRRSESHKLEQEYIHKIALAKSYSSYKKQIDDLKEEDQQLLSKLLELAIHTIAKNLSDELDKKHGDDLPAIELIKEMSKLFGKTREISS